MDTAQKTLQKNVDTFWELAQLNLETTQKALANAQKDSTEQLEKAFDLSSKAQDAKDLTAIKDLLAEVNREHQAAIEKFVATTSDLVQEYVKSTQATAEKYFNK